VRRHAAFNHSGGGAGAANVEHERRGPSGGDGDKLDRLAHAQRRHAQRLKQLRHKPATGGGRRARRLGQKEGVLGWVRSQSVKAVLDQSEI